MLMRVVSGGARQAMTGVACGLCLLSLTSFVAAQKPAELREWETEKLVELADSSDLQQRRDAVYELVRRRDQSECVIACFVELADESDEQLQFQALMGLARSGARSLRAAEVLLEVLNDRNDQMRYRAADALGNMGPDVLPLLMETWPKANTNQKIGLSLAFQRMGKDASDTKPFLLEAMSDRDANVVDGVVNALASVAPADAELWCELSSHQESNVRFVAIKSLAAVEDPGEPVRRCLENAIHDAEPRVREQALISMARSQIPLEPKLGALLAAIEDDEYSVRSAALAGIRMESSLHAEALARLVTPLLECTSPEKVESYLQLVSAVSKTNPIPDLVPAILDRAVAMQLPPDLVAEAIASLGPSGVDTAIQGLSTNDKVGPYVSLSIARAGNSAEEILFEAIENESPVIRVSAIQAAGALQPTSERLIGPLIQGLVDEASKVRLAAVESLGVIAGSRLTADSAEVVKEINEAIVGALGDRDDLVRAAVIRQVVVAKLSTDQETLLIDEGLADSSEATRVAALECLLELPALLEKRSKRVFELLDSDQASVRSLAFRALGGFNGKAEKEEAIARLVDGLSDPSVQVRVSATQSLKELKASSDEFVTLIAGNLGDDLDLLRVSLEGLGKLGTAASGQTSTISNLLQHPTVDIRISAIETLASISSDKSKLTDSLIEALGDSEWTVRCAACEELGEIGKPAKKAIPKLFAMIDVEEDESIATGAIRDIGAASVEDLPMLMGGYDSENLRKRLYAVFLTGKIGEAAKEALPRLEELLEEANGSRRSGTAKKFILQAIDSIEGDD